MKTIIPHFWFVKDAKQAAETYTSLFPNSQITNISTIKDTPSGDCDIVNFTLFGKRFMAIGAGGPPAGGFHLNPSISLFVTFNTEEEIDKAWNTLSENGKILMPYQSYPWAEKYGWLQDQHGLSWQLSLSKNHQMQDPITPMLMFTGKNAGKTKEAIEFYSEIFANSKTEMLVAYEEGEGDQQGFIKHARFSLDGNNFLAMDSSAPHEFNFNEAVSFIVKCENQEEIDYFWEKLSSVKEAEQCGWLKDKYGISWQIVPTAMDKMMSGGTPEQMQRVTQAFLQMKKFDIKTLEEAFAW
jgi:predicted 3-demethylubiquinone-9 3-methyltransferase (glyoxalase superfamily)